MRIFLIKNKSNTLYFNSFTGIKSVCQVFFVIYVTELVTNYFGAPDNGVDIGMGVAVYPRIDVVITKSVSSILSTLFW